MPPPDGHLIKDAGIAFFPESGKLYRVPPLAVDALCAWLAGTGHLPPEGAAMAAEAERSPAPPVTGSAIREVSSLCLYTAHDCNLACAYCYNQRGRATKPFAMMSLATAQAAIDRFFYRPGVSYALALYGGEPLLNTGLIRPLVDYVAHLRQERGIHISLSTTTNGTVMNRELLQLLAQHFSSVTVSLDGPAAINDLHRRYARSEGSGAHDRAVATIRLLKEQTRLRVTVKGTLTAQGLPHYRESLAYLRSLGADAASLDPVFAPAGDDWALSDEEFAQYVAMQAEDAAADLDDPEERQRPWQEYTFQIVAGLMSKRRLLRHCNMGCDPAVMADGSVYACHGLAGEPAFHMGPVEAADDPDFHRLHAECSALDIRSIDDCAVCWARYLCGGGCYANAWFQSGSLRRSDTRHCLLFKAVAERVIPAFVATMTDPSKAKALLKKMRAPLTSPQAHA